MRRGHSLAYVPTNQNVRVNPLSPQAQGLVGAWPFWASRYASVIKDLSGPNDAVPSGTNYGWQETDNELGTGVFVDGWESHTFDCGNAAALQVAASGLTICAWVRMYQNFGSTSFPGLISKGDADSSTAGSYLMYFAFFNTNPAVARYSVGFLDYSGSARKDQLSGVTNLDFQGTYFIAATWQPSTRASLFINGLREATNTTSVPATLDNPAYNFLIGSNQGGADKTKYPFRGLIFEARLYNTFKTEDEIWQMWNPPTRWDLYRAPKRFISKPLGAVLNKSYYHALFMG